MWAHIFGTFALWAQGKAKVWILGHSIAGRPSTDCHEKLAEGVKQGNGISAAFKNSCLSRHGGRCL